MLLFDLCYTEKAIKSFSFVLFIVLLENRFEKTIRDHYVNSETVSQRPIDNSWVDPIET